ncbi:MAG: TetR/AcrR family transcriptional regulator [Rhodococcus sp. (in: high G+C Gram-positive bacteria)]
MGKDLPSTSKGRRTRAAIVDAAADEMYSRGVARTSVGVVLAASGFGKSQFYHYFDDKSDLIVAVIDRQLGRVLAAQPLLHHIDGLDGLDAWSQQLIAGHRAPGGPFTCPLGSLAAELRDDAFAPALEAAFRRWAEPIERGLRGMVDRGELDVDVDPSRSAAMIVAAVQGGILAACIAGDVRPLEDVLRVAVDSIRRHHVGRKPSTLRPVD